MGKGGLDGQLVSAVRAGDAGAVRSLLKSGTDPDTVDATGLPVLCVAVAAYDEHVAGALVEGGADPDRLLPDGTTPLWRAVDGGSPAIVSAVLGDEPRLRLSEASRERLLVLARNWYETGAAEQLRRRTRAPGPAETVRVQDDDVDRVDQVSLGGLVVRAGHSAVLTLLEWAFRVLTPVDELIARAVEHPADDDVNAWAVHHVLIQRRSTETWSAVVALRHHPAPAQRLVTARYLWTRAIVRCGPGHHEKEEGELLAGWAAEETDSEVLAQVLAAFSEHGHPEQEAIALRYADHPDPRVRRRVPDTLHVEGAAHTPAATAALLTLAQDPVAAVRSSACTMLGVRDDHTPEIVRALLRLAQDPDAQVRATAAVALAASRDRTPAVADALVALLAEDDRIVRLEAAYGLARRDDPRTGEAIERVGPLGPGFEHDHRVSGLWQWVRRQEDSAAARQTKPMPTASEALYFPK
ncbi:HEAT repeat domain-containing protein [Streptomyces sp. NPDC059832]|uniref:HEAT repeat domain-containing protein n=1 Tax=Streptomyces sp. NPDC059832 TaxID=3346966 RepID=UPI00365B591D